MVWRTVDLSLLTPNPEIRAKSSIILVKWWMIFGSWWSRTASSAKAHAPAPGVLSI